MTVDSWKTNVSAWNTNVRCIRLASLESTHIKHQDGELHLQNTPKNTSKCCCMATKLPTLSERCSGEASGLYKGIMLCCDYMHHFYGTYYSVILKVGSSLHEGD